MFGRGQPNLTSPPLLDHPTTLQGTFSS